MKHKISEIIISILIILISWAVYIYLFTFADRKIVFLYDHLRSTPFDVRTTGRYWMVGLVLSGFLTIAYLVLKLIIKLIPNSEESNWKAILKISCVPLALGIVIITMNFGEPQMTFLIAISSAASLIFGLIIGLSVVDDLILNFTSTLIYIIMGLGMVPFLTLFRVLELPSKHVVTLTTATFVSVLSIIGGLFWIIITNNHKVKILPINIIKGTLIISYLGGPVLHFLFVTTNRIPYITASSNFFADNYLLRITTWILLILIVLLGDKLSKTIIPDK